MFQLAGIIETGVNIAADRIQSRLILSDSLLIARVKDGDKEAFGEIVKRYQGFVYRQAWGYLQDNEAAKDAAQDVFIAAYKGITYLRNDSALRQWLYRICRNHCLNVIRRRKLEHKFHSEASNEVSSDEALRITIRDLISELDDPYREVIILRYYHDLTYEQIAQVLDISLSTVKIRLFRTKKMLKRMLGEKTDEMR
jgi:RNA polymerase sigma-70 factor (ECF subfamily)